MPIIVLEGQDGGGKSTLGKKLEGVLSVPYFYPPKPESIDSCTKSCQNLRTLAESRHWTIVDRVPWISDMVYSRIFDRQTYMPLEDFQKMWHYPQVVVFCNPKGIGFDNMKVDNKPYKSAEHTARVKREYNQVIDLYDGLIEYFEPKQKEFFPVLTYDFQELDSFANTVNRLKGIIQKHQTEDALKRLAKR